VMSSHGWLAVDFDGTLAEHTSWQGPEHTGAPVSRMVRLVKNWLADGREVRIFTARAYPLALQMPRHYVGPNDILPMQHTIRGLECQQAIDAIRQWCATHIGRVLPITCVKDYGMDEI